MRIKELIISLLTPVLVSAMLIFISCAQKERVQEDTEFDEQTIDSAEAEAEEAAGEDLGDIAASELAEPPPVAVEPPPEEPAPETPPENADITSLEPDPAASSPEPLPEGPAAVPDLARSETEPPPVGGESGDATPPPPTDIIDETKLGIDPVPPPPSVGRGSFSASLPQIPADAFEKEGALLNRFYFVRKGDSPNSISSLLYGNPGHAKDLMSWNGKIWAPGKLLYYSSPVQPEDRQMRSFYQEGGITPEGYVVSGGDWLSKIAQKKYGDVRSWKEIAVINGVDNPDRISSGQKLALYPANFDGYSPSTAKNTPPPLPVKPADTQKDAVAQASPPLPSEVIESPAIPEPPPVKPISKPKVVPSTDSEPELDWAKMIEQHMFFIALGLVLLVLLILLSVVNKRKKARKNRGEFTDDGFAPPKMRRK